jgi:polyisoprenoid-binding protein YceI
MTTASADQAGQATASFAAPASWQLDPSGSSASVTHKTIWGLVTVRGSFEQVSGSAEILADGAARGRIELGAASLNTKHAKRDKHLRSADFFDADKHPQIVAELTQATRAGEDSVAAEGTLTVAGVTKPLALTAKITEATPDAITLSAETEVDRADFGLTWNQLGMIKGKAQVSVVARFVK